MRLFDVLPNFAFTTSEPMGDYYLQTWCIRVASQVTKRCKTLEIRKYVPSLPAKMKVLLILAENSCKTEIKPFPPCAISHES